ncbi:muramoyltetrapeptide carboxypeptidase [Entomoplasma freundtii]|uniref:Uncharacterized protein n=1 Tax=Entomoplasma freundtii TaxID=74700 RepID=A0A2K8NTI1_9MOLU|nr:S66 peptidase family protein [Entomoplasma freundtii]ATZ16488.1 hypothetical protein EFREU_v1c04620 [Entomoplasma freundtii]TDY56017.1 muramoyltetrapeptide carboxypeptidase [Entomoplasma freundtii]
MKIGIFTASTPISSLFPLRSQNAISFLEKQGHKVIVGNLFKSRDFYRSGSIQSRAQEINNLVKEPLDWLMANIGGYNTNAILPYLDYELINENVQAIVGFSDTTALLNAVAQKCPKVKVFYGPALTPNFGEWEPFLQEMAYQNLFHRHMPLTDSGFLYETSPNWVTIKAPSKIVTNTWQVKNKNHHQTITGIVKGGNLSTLMGIWGSEYAPVFTNQDILFIEDAEKTISEVERYFSFLKINGIFDKVRAVILGTHHQFQDFHTERQPIDVLIEVLNGQPLPIIYDVNISHSKPMLCLKLNSLTTIDFDKLIIMQ